MLDAGVSRIEIVAALNQKAPMHATPTQSLASAGKASKKPPRRKPTQPLTIIDVAGAMLTLTTLATISGQSISSLYRDAKAGRLKLRKRGTRCTRVTSEDARAYLESLNRGAS